MYNCATRSVCVWMFFWSNASQRRLPCTVPVGEKLGHQEVSAFRCLTKAKLGSPSVSALL